MKWLLIVGLAATALGELAQGEEAPVSYRNEVMPILARAGCNQGACHGNLNGKGGFKLSLRGEDPSLDLLVMSRDLHARRLDRHQPDQSLILQKATGLVAHEGGPRFSTNSTEYRLMKRWIAEGCRDDEATAPRATKLLVTPRESILIEPKNSLKITVKGEFSDGQTRELNHLAVFETTTLGTVSLSADGEVKKIRDGELNVIVRYLHLQVPVTLAFIPPRANFSWPEHATSKHPIDQHVYQQLKSLRLTPSPLADDSMFIRRAYLDTCGVLPNAAETAKFLEDRTPNKREQLIERLLRRPEYADYWAQKWSDLLRNEEKALDRKGVRVFHQWIRDAIDRDLPLNQLAKEIVAARGSTYQHPEANFYRSLREPYARAESVAQVFLGIRLQCAKCHNHPFDRWTQTDYHEFAALFAQVDYRLLDNTKGDRLDKHEFNGEQIVFANRDLSMKHPRTGSILQPRIVSASHAVAPGRDPLTDLGDWLASPKNPFFAQAQANRIWLHVMGKALVEPNDDFRESNPALNPALLACLTEELTKNRFSLRQTIRFIMTSQTYQFSSSPGRTNGDDDSHFSKAIIQPLEAEQLLDAVSQVTGSRPKFDGYPRGTRAGQVAAMPQDRRSKKGGMSERFLKVFGKPDRLLTCECERSDDTGLMQAFQLLTGEMLQEQLTDPNNRLGKLIEAGKTDAEIIDQLYLHALSRYPTATEKKNLQRDLSTPEARRSFFEDVTWALVNSKEFLLRR